MPDFQHARRIFKDIIAAFSRPASLCSQEADVPPDENVTCHSHSSDFPVQQAPAPLCQGSRAGRLGEAPGRQRTFQSFR